VDVRVGRPYPNPHRATTARGRAHDRRQRPRPRVARV